MTEREWVKGNGGSLAQPKAILLIQLGDIGDLVLSTPCIRALRDTFPDARLAVAVREKAAELLADCPWLDEVISVRKSGKGLGGELFGQLGFVLALRRDGFDLAIDLRTGTRGAILARLSGAPRRLGFFADNEAWWRNALFTDLLHFDYRPEIHVVDYLLGLLEAYGVRSRYRNPELVVSPRKLNEADDILRGLDFASRKLAVLQPFSLWRYKEWGEIKYVELIRWLVQEKNIVVLIAGTAQERERAAHIARACGDGCCNLAGQTSLSLYAAILKRSELFIGVDSAGLHIAAAVGTPTVGIFGPSASSSWGPRGVGHFVVRNENFSCIPCRNKGCDDNEISLCLDQLSIDEVVNVVGRALAIGRSCVC